MIVDPDVAKEATPPTAITPPTATTAITPPTATTAITPPTATTPPSTPMPAALTDVVDLWATRRAPPTKVKLETVRISESTTLLIPFTTTIAAGVACHYLNSTVYRGFARCSGDGCVLCRLGRKQDMRDLLPVYDPIAASVVVMAIPPNLRPGALAPQLHSGLARVKAGERIMLEIRKVSEYEYEVLESPLPADANDGAVVIARFKADFDAGQVDLASVFATFTAAELKRIPEVATQARLKGIQL